MREAAISSSCDGARFQKISSGLRGWCAEIGAYGDEGAFDPGLQNLIGQWGGIMAAQNFAISNLMEVDDVSLVQQNGVSYLKVKSTHLTTLGWERKNADLQEHGYYRNWLKISCRLGSKAIRTRSSPTISISI